MISIIVAVAQNNAIGRENELLWHISEDLKYFKSVTISSPVIMGRKTYESIGRPLPGRRNIVLSRKGFDLPVVKNPETTSIEIVNSLEEVLEITKGDKEYFIMGGGMLYNEFFSLADRLYITKIYANAEGADTFFPEVDDTIWEIEEQSEMHYDNENGIEFCFLRYRRR